MGTSKTPDQLVKKLNDAGKALTSNRPAVEATCLAVKGVFTAALTTAGVRGSTAISKRVKARYDVRGETNATGLVRYTGPAHLLNNPTKPHGIVSKKNRGSRKSRSERSDGVGMTGAVLVNGEPRAYAQHPGTAGLHFYERAKPVAVELAPKVYAKAGIAIPLKRVFG